MGSGRVEVTTDKRCQWCGEELRAPNIIGPVWHADCYRLQVEVECALKGVRLYDQDKGSE